MSVLTGSLEHFALPDVFRLLARNRATGALKVARASGEGNVFFADGEVYFAFSNLTKEFLGQRLVNAKLITQGQLLRVLDEQKKAGEKRIGDLMVEKGFISKELLDTFLKEQIQDAIFSMLEWDVGSFEFLSDERAPQEVGLSASVENLIMESSRRIQEWEVIRRKIPTLEVVVRMAPVPPEDTVEINIRPEEWTLLVLADGSRTVREIAGASERSEFEACKIIYGLVTAGLLDVASGATAVGTTRVPSGVPSFREAPEAPAEEQIEAEAEPAHKARAGKRTAEADEAPPVTVEVVADRDSGGVTITEEHAAAGELEPAAAGEAPGNGSASQTKISSGGRKSDPAVSKELLERLIAGVRNL